MGLAVDYPTFFELFAHSGTPVQTLEECLLGWKGKFAAIESGKAASAPGGAAAAAGPAQPGQVGGL